MKKRKKLKLSRAERKKKEAQAALEVGLKRGTIIPVDPAKIVSRSAIPSIPEFYRDKMFRCKDCSKKELWTARQQQQWHEEMGGEIEAVAVRCLACRRKENRRKTEARKIHLEGLRKRQAGEAEKREGD